MLQHIVMWRLHDKAQAPQLIARLQALADLPMVGALEAGLNISPRPVAWDVVLVSSFADEAALEAYRVHPDHQAVVSYLADLAADTAVVDYLQ